MGKDKLRRAYRNERHVRLYRYMTSSEAWHDLSGNAVKLLVFLATWEDGENNGEIFMSERMAADGIGVSKRTAGKLFDELEQHGFIAPTAKGYFSRQRAATCWRLTWLTWPARSSGPTNEWRSWRPDEQKSQAQLLNDTGAGVAPEASVRRTTGEDIAPVAAGEVQPPGAESSPHSIAIGDGQRTRPQTVNQTPKIRAAAAAAVWPGGQAAPIHITGRLVQQRARFQGASR
jgi:hypothetical protein